MSGELIIGDCRAALAEWATAGRRVQCCVTSPPYWGLRDYGVAGQIGLESTPGEYVDHLVEVFRLVRNLLTDDGTLWLNLGDSYAMTTKGAGGHTAVQDNNGGSWHADRRWKIPPTLKPKDLVGIPWRVAFALQADGWYLRSDIIWSKPNPMPESVADRPTKAHEYLFLLAKAERYYYDAAAIAERRLRAGDIPLGGRASRNALDPRVSFIRPENAHKPIAEWRNRRSVWELATAPYPDAHFATFPPDLVKPCILAGSRPGDTVLDPFMGAGTVAMVAQDLGRRWLGCELKPEYVAMIEQRTRQLGFADCWAEAAD